VSVACAAQKYAFPEAEKYHFPKGKTGLATGGYNYFRIEHDAVNLNCFTEYCYIDNKVQDAFIDDPKP